MKTAFVFLALLLGPGSIAAAQQLCPHGLPTTECDPGEVCWHGNCIAECQPPPTHEQICSDDQSCPGDELCSSAHFCFLPAFAATCTDD